MDGKLLREHECRGGVMVSNGHLRWLGVQTVDKYCILASDPNLSIHPAVKKVGQVGASACSGGGIWGVVYVWCMDTCRYCPVYAQHSPPPPPTHPQTHPPTHTHTHARARAFIHSSHRHLPHPQTVANLLRPPTMHKVVRHAVVGC